MFVIMGLSGELGDKLAADVYREMVDARLPQNLQLIPYDTLLMAFEAKLPPRFYFLVSAPRHTLVELDGLTQWARGTEWEAAVQGVIRTFERAVSGWLTSDDGAQVAAIHMLVLVDKAAQRAVERVSQATDRMEALHLSGKDLRASPLAALGRVVSAAEIMGTYESDFQDWLRRIKEVGEVRNRWAHGYYPAFAGRLWIDDARRVVVEALELLRWICVGDLSKLWSP